jgi:hypothetical protein
VFVLLLLLLLLLLLMLMLDFGAVLDGKHLLLLRDSLERTHPLALGGWVGVDEQKGVVVVIVVAACGVG